MLSGPPRTADPIADWCDITALFGLPEPHSTPSAVLGGWSHSVWKVDTEAGTFAIKEMREGRGGWWIDQLEAAIAFELAAWRAGTVAMAEPIPVEGSDLFHGRLVVGDAHRRYRCHRWVDGEPALGTDPDRRRPAQVGVIVAELSRLDVRKGTTADQLEWNAIDAYDDTVAEASSRGLDWTHALAGLRPHVERLRHDFEDLARRAIPMTVTHRDIDPKNARIRADGDVVLFDWDNAGPRLLESELLVSALSFAGTGGHADENCVLSTLDAYVEAGGRPLAFADAAAPIAEGGFRWIMLNAWRSLGHRDVSPEQQAFAGSMVKQLSATWPADAERVRAWASRAHAHADRISQASST